MNNLKIGIIVADSDEYASLQEVIEKGDFAPFSYLGRKGHSFKIGNCEVLSLLCGIGKVNAAAATAHLIDIGCNIILNYGLSGGVSGISKGELCLCDRFLEHDFDLTGLGYKPCEKPSQSYIYNGDKQLIEQFLSIYPEVKTGTSVTGDSFICDPEVRDYLKEEFGAMSCDMETAAIAYVCEFSNVPFLALRKISDDAGEDAVSSYRKLNSMSEAVLSDCLIEFIGNKILCDFEAK